MADIEFLESRGIDVDAPSPGGQPCPACGCPIEPHDHFCPACGTPCRVAPTDGAGLSRDKIIDADVVPETPVVGVQPGPSPAAPGRLEPAAAPPSDDGHKHYRCKNCGAEVHADTDQRSFVCPFCDSAYVVEFAPEQVDRQPPEFVIGFAVTPEQALERFHQWLADNSWFRPGDLRRAVIADKMKGVYLPFWGFTMLARSRWSATIGEYWYRTETYITRDSKGNMVTRTRQVQETEWWPLSGRHHRYYAGFLVSGSRGLPQADAERIKPFNLPALKRYEPYFLAGWLAEEYSIARDEALKICQQEFYGREQANVAAFLPGDRHRELTVSTEFSDVNSDLCLLPVYILSYRYQDQVYRFLVNGQTGKFAGDKPLSWQRITAAIVGGLVLILLVILLIALVANS